MSRRHRRKPQFLFETNPIDREMMYGNGAPLSDEKLKVFSAEYGDWKKRAYLKYRGMTDAQKDVRT